MSDPRELAAVVRERHSQAMEALAADVHPISGSAIRARELEMSAALDALLTECERYRAANHEYENCITWDTTCKNCAKLMDKNYEEYVRAEQAVTRARRYEEALREIADAVEQFVDVKRTMTEPYPQLQRPLRAARAALAEEGSPRSPFPKPRMVEIGSEFAEEEA